MKEKMETLNNQLEISSLTSEELRNFVAQLAARREAVLANISLED